MDMDKVTTVTAKHNNLRIAVGPSGNPNLLPPVFVSVHHSIGTLSMCLSEDEARAFGQALVEAADAWDEENSKRGEQFDEMRLEA